MRAAQAARANPDEPRTSRTAAVSSVRAAAAVTHDEEPPLQTAPEVARAALLPVAESPAPPDADDSSRQRDSSLRKKMETGSWYWAFVEGAFEEKLVPPGARYEAVCCRICNTIIKLNSESSVFNIKSHVDHRSAIDSECQRNMTIREPHANQLDDLQSCCWRCVPLLQCSR
jgi:hypothetical protein